MFVSFVFEGEGRGSRVVWRILFCFVPEGKGRRSRVIRRILSFCFMGKDGGADWFGGFPAIPRNLRLPRKPANGSQANKLFIRKNSDGMPPFLLGCGFMRTET